MTSPVSTPSGAANPGPSQTNVWNSPRSPHGSTPRGRSARNSQIEAPAAKGRRELARVHARHDRLDADVDHLVGQCRRRPAPQREDRLQPGRGESALTVGPHVLEEEVPEDHLGDAVLARNGQSVAHEALVDLVRARKRQLDDVHGEAQAVRLLLEQSAAHGVHGHPVRCVVDGAQEAGDVDPELVSSDVEGKGAVLPAAPAHPGRSGSGLAVHEPITRHRGSGDSRCRSTIHVGGGSRRSARRARSPDRGIRDHPRRARPGEQRGCGRVGGDPARVGPGEALRVAGPLTAP